MHLVGRGTINTGNPLRSFLFESLMMVLTGVGTYAYRREDGVYVVSVLRYNSTNTLLRYGGGQYTEGIFRVDIVGDRLQLTDPTDGTVYYQR